MAEHLTQRSTRWRRKRLGDVTCSRYGDVMTRPQSKADREAGKLSKTAEAYMCQLIAERITGEPWGKFTAPATEWGSDREPEAFARVQPLIEETFGEPLFLPVDDLAYVSHPTEDGIGGSPDGFIGDDGIVEIKCPYNPARHVATVLRGEVPREHKPQVQGYLWICEKKWYAFVSYDPRMERGGLDPLYVEYVERDPEYIDELAERVIDFRDRLNCELEAFTAHNKLAGYEEPF